MYTYTVKGDRRMTCVDFVLEIYSYLVLEVLDSNTVSMCQIPNTVTEGADQFNCLLEFYRIYFCIRAHFGPIKVKAI